MKHFFSYGAWFGNQEPRSKTQELRFQKLSYLLALVSCLFLLIIVKKEAASSVLPLFILTLFRKAMEVIRLILSPIWKVWFFVCFTVPFLLLFPFFYVAFITRQIGFAFGLKKVWAILICIFSGIIPVIKWRHGKYTLPKNCIIVCNHTSYLDIVLSVLPVKHTALFMAKAELMQIPLFKLFFKYMDIPVNRKSKMDSHKAFIDAGKKIDEGYSLIIYPEGGISSEGVLKPFKNGAFKMAIEKQVPIVPMVCLNNWKLLQNGGFFKSFGRPGRANIIVGRPIDTTELTEENLVDLREEARTFILDELLKHSQKNNGTKN